MAQNSFFFTKQTGENNTAPQTSAAKDDARRQRDERQCDEGDSWTTTTPA
jgi:hypothetical protein